MPGRELPEQLRFLQSRGAVQKRYEGGMNGKVCVVTGSTSGVGLEAARALASGGASLVLICRDTAKAEALRGELLGRGAAGLQIIRADFSDLDEVRAAAATLLATQKRIDVLINSAGLHSTTRRVTGAGFELVFCVNHLAVFLLTDLLLGRLRESAPSRVIQVNSEGHRFGGLDLDDLNWERRHYTGLRGYGASKMAQLLTTWEFARRLEGTGVSINAMHPGDVRTNIGSNNGPLYRAFSRLFIRPLLKDPAISGSALYWLAGAPELAGISGRFYHLTVEERPEARSLDPVTGARAWEVSRRLTGLEAWD